MGVVSAYNFLVDDDPLSLRDIAQDLDRFARKIVDSVGTECRYDHHGYCQEHWLDERPCPMETIAKVLAIVDGIDGYE